MIRSMTGYGRSEIVSAGIHLTIEARSVNNRFIDVQIKAPRFLSGLEPRIKKTVQDHCSRGRIDIFISRSGERETAGRVVVDEHLVSGYMEALKSLKERFDLAGQPDLALVASFPGLISQSEEQDDLETLWQALSGGLDKTLTELDAMRRQEGDALVLDIRRRLDLIEKLMQSIGSLAPATVEQARKRMTDAVARLLHEQPDPARLAQEIAILAERTDVTEELTRLDSHLRQFRSLIAGSAAEPVGRKLDFLLQEMGREANTIASKAMNAQIAHQVVEVKAELEKIREQVQNIE